MRKYDSLSQETISMIEEDRRLHNANPYAFDDLNAIRRYPNTKDSPTLFRSNFIRDVDKIINCPFYNRYSDKTQVFSLYRNDDITRRSLHVQLVSRIARTIGKALNLNLELIESISLGHDLGHTPFGHEGETFLNELYIENSGRIFAHNLQSIRVLDSVFPYNITLQTLDGIAGHNGEIERQEYHPQSIKNFEEFDNLIESCYTDKNLLKTLAPSTLEGCLVRICDIIAYLGKDRQDGTRTNVHNENDYYNEVIGSTNAEIINNLSINLIENSYRKNYIKLDKEYFEALKIAKNENYLHLYNTKEKIILQDTIKPMMNLLYKKFINDLNSKNHSSPIYTEHVNYISKPYLMRNKEYLEEDFNQVVVDFIASMTDDYFIEIFKSLFPEKNYQIKYTEYFNL